MSDTPLYFRRTVVIEAQNVNGDKIKVCVRYFEGARNWEVFVDGGLLGDGRESAFFWRFPRALDFAMSEVETAENS